MSETDTGDSLSNVAEYSVSEISAALRRTVEDAFGHVRVRGEISGFRGRHSSGHAYFALKDDKARIEAVIWRGTFARLRFPPEEGMEVVVTGRLTTYAGSSKYQIVIDTLEPAGAGALMALLEERKRKLGAEGLFDEARKRPLPFMPRVIGVVTSPTGAVIRDIVHRINDRFPVHVLVWPVRVQGETAGAEAAAAVAGFNAFPADHLRRPDVIIVARGGGSLEDMWGFNDEALVRAVAASHIPIISAVGHETDWTLVDLAADRRAPTPTGAAEMAVPVKAELEASVSRLSARLKGAVSRERERKHQALKALSRALPAADQILAMPQRRFDEAASRLARALEANTRRKRSHFGGIRLTPATLERRLGEARRQVGQCGARLPNVFLALVRNRRTRFDRDAGRVTPAGIVQSIRPRRERLATLEQRAGNAFGVRVQDARRRLDHATRLAGSLSYKAILERGFALVRDAKERPLKRAAAISAGAELRLEFADGAVSAVAAGRKKSEPDRRAKKSETPHKGDQGSLF